MICHWKCREHIMVLNAACVKRVESKREKRREKKEREWEKDFFSFLSI